MRQMKRLLFFLLLFVTSLVAYAGGPDFGSRPGYWSDHYGRAPEGTPLGGYEISSPEQLAYVSHAIRDGLDRDTWLRAKLVLKNDIDMGAYYWYPMEDWQGSLDGNGHKIINLYAYKGEDNEGGFVSRTPKNASNVTIENVTFKNCQSQAGKYVGLVIGDINDNSNVAFKNVRLEGCSVSSAQWNYSGGFTGFIDGGSNVTFTNCHSDVYMGAYCKKYVGGFVGYVQKDNTKVGFYNCVSVAEGNGTFANRNSDFDCRGGYIGKAESKTILRFKDSAVICAYQSHWGNTDENKQFGALVGDGHEADVQCNDCYIDSNAASMETWRIHYFLFGYHQPERLSETSSFYCLTTSSSGRKNIQVAYKANQKGANYAFNGNTITPCVNDSDKVLLLDCDKLTSVSSASIGDGIYDRKVYMAALRPTTYNVASVSDQWIYADETDGSIMQSKERLGKWKFSGVPLKDGKMSFKMLKRPTLVWQSTEYNPVRMAVDLKWSCLQKGDLSDYWSKRGGKIYVYRNDERIDSLDCTETSWTDKNPLYGKLNKYRLVFACKELRFDEADNVSNLVWETKAEWNSQLGIDVSGKVGKVEIKVPMPNSKMLDGCSLSLYKLVAAAGGSTSEIDPSEPIVGKGATLLGTATFHSDNSRNEYINVAFTDNEATVPCSKWIYQAVCDGFTADEFKDHTVYTSKGEFIDSNEFEIAQFAATKGESTDKIKVDWKTSGNKAAASMRYELSRLQYRQGLDYDAVVSGAEAADWKTIYTVDNTTSVNAYTDNVLPGYVYIYRLRAYPSCDGTYNKNVYATASDIGYAASRGTIMGSIVYGSGSTAVEGVDVRLTADNNSLEGKKDVYSMCFKDGADCLPLAPELNADFWNGDWTLNFMLRPNTNKTVSRLATVPGKWALSIDDDLVSLCDEDLLVPSKDDFFFVMLRHDAAQGKLYLGYTITDSQNESKVAWCKGVADADAANWLLLNTPMSAKRRVDADQLVFGQFTDRDSSFNGYLDEVRLWNKALSDKELANTYNRYLTGNESGLEAYYTFDSGVAEFAFDGSHPEGLWNNRNQRVPVVDCPKVVNNVTPSADCLSYRGTTDRNGEYQIAGVPYTGEGTNYQVVPIFGTHEFKPASTRRYVSSQSLSHTGVNFTDESAFRVPVQASYIYGNIPAEGLYITIDGVIQNDADGNMITTDADGKAVVNVPIGRHKLAVVSAKHTMVNNGYPASLSEITADGKCIATSLADRYGYIDFQADYTAAATFYDSTLVRVVGRVAGGADEGSQPIGFRKSKNNLGQAVLTFTPSLPKTYMVNSRDYDIVPADTIDVIKSEQVLPAKGYSVRITTDAETGEYSALLPPVRWEVTKVVSKKDGISDFGDLSQYINVINLDPKNEKADTLWLDSVGIHDATKTDTYRTFVYNTRQKYTLYTTPELTLTNNNAQEGYEAMLGEPYALPQYFDKERNVYVDDTLHLWKSQLHDGSPDSYILGLPVFKTGSDYSMLINIREKYYNHDSGETTVVPVRGASVTVYNKLSNKYFSELSTGDYELKESFVDTATVKTNATESAGSVVYNFSGGVPNPVGDHVLPMTLSYTVNSITYTKDYKGYVFGSIARGGNNFVTEGPKKLIAVLFDPPGSSSSAYIDAGTTMTAKLQISESASVTTDNQIGSLTGVKGTESVALPSGKICQVIDTETSGDNGLVVSGKAEEGWSHDFTKSYTLKEKISTGTDANHVGAMGDVYIGRNVNWVFCKADMVEFKEATGTDGFVSATGHRYLIDKWVGYGKYDKDSTSFRLSQYDIINTQIPDLMKNRNALTTFVDKLPAPDAVQKKEGAYQAFALKSCEKKEYWESDEFLTVEPSSTGGEEVVEDLVTRFNSAIGQWQQLISEVEETKYNTFQKKDRKVYKSGFTSFNYGFLDNYSFDAGTSLANSFTSNESTTGTQTTSLTVGSGYSWDTKVLWSAGMKVMSHTKLKVVGSATAKRVGTDTESRSTTIGYTLADNNIGDHFSVDVYMPGEEVDMKTNNVKKFFMASPYMFRTRAGQSRVPYEKPQMSRYFKVDGQPVALDDGTVSMDVPSIQFETRELRNVPSGTTASVKVRLSNNSTCSTTSGQFMYSFFCVSAEDTKGLEMTIDGQPLANGATFLLKPGMSVERTMTFRQTRLDVSDYDNLVFKLQIFAPDAITDTLSIHFQPQAPKMNIESNDGFVYNSDNKTGKMLLKLGGYSADYYGFTGVRLQYKQANEQTWHTQRYLFNDTKRWTDTHGELPEGWRQLSSDNVDTCSIDMSALPEGTYQVRAQSFSIVSPSEELTADTDPITIVKDTKAPVVMGSPQPSNGYYDGSRDISVTFNEPIKLSALNDDNFYVTAELNDAEVTHRTGLHFDGNTPARTKARISVFGQSSTLAFWFKPQTGKKSCLFNQTLASSVDSIPVKLFYNDDATLSLLFGDRLITSQRKAVGVDGKPEQDWMYLAMTYDEDMHHVDVYNLSGTSTEAQSKYISTTVDGLSNLVNCNVPMYVGGSSDGDGCYTEMEGLVMYDGAKLFADIAKDKNNKHTANLRGLLAYWPMERGYGNTATEKVRSRDLYLSGTDNWYMPVKNYALHANGKDQYMLVNTSGYTIDKASDYVLELMFRTAGKLTAPATLFSNGWGGAVSTEDADRIADRLSVSLDADGRVLFCAAGHTYAPMGKGYDDNQWHHLALCVNRSGYATVLVDTVDISNNELIAGSDIGALSNSQMAVGALVYRDAASGKSVASQFFGGDIDEVRIWDKSSTLANVKRNVGERLRGNEPGLVAYYPFERTDLVANQEKTTPTLRDRTAANESTGFQPAADPTMSGYGDYADVDAIAEKAVTENGPRLKAAGFKSRIGIDWVCSETDRNKIVLSFPDALSKSRIEGCTVNFTVSDILDDNGNRMQQPVSWNVFVDQNAFMVSLNQDEESVVVGNSTKMSLFLYNTNALTQQWTLTNIPSWIKASAVDGALAPLTSTTLTLTTSADLGIGNYQDVMYLITEDGLQKALPVSLTVTGERPEWEVNVDSDEWMAVLGRLKFRDRWCTDENSIVAAFDSDGKCHAVASPVYDENMDAYFIHMNVVGGMPADGKLTFKVWEAPTGLVYSNVSFTEQSLGERTELAFRDKEVLGSFSYPCVFRTDNVTHQEFNLRKGWNWLSLWVRPTSDNYKEVFAGADGIVSEVKRQYATAADRRPNTALNINESYHVYSPEGGTLDIAGPIVKADTVTVKLTAAQNGKTVWRWIGYPLGTMSTISEALADMTPVVNDIIKSQSEYAIYNGNAWVGNLKRLKPGEGYLYGYHGTSDASWTYPDKSDGYGALAPSLEAAARSVSYRFSADRCRYSANATLLADVLVDGRPAAGMQLGAFVDGECRGWTTVDSTGIAYLVVSGDEASSRVKYRLADPATGAVWAVRGQDSFAANAMIGSPSQPRLLSAETGAHFNLGVNPDEYEDYDYLTATVLDSDGKPFAHDYEIAAFAENGECRGVSVADGGKDAEMSVYGSVGETFTFRLWDMTTLEEIALTGIKTYDALTPNQHVTLRIGTTGIDRIGADGDAKGAYYTITGVRHDIESKEQGVYVKKNRKVAVRRR